MVSKETRQIHTCFSKEKVELLLSQGEKGIEGKQGLQGEMGQKGDPGEVSRLSYRNECKLNIFLIQTGEIGPVGPDGLYF